MHTVAATENQHQHQLVERALAQLGELESRLPSLVHETLVMAAWLEFLERGKQLDA